MSRKPIVIVLAVLLLASAVGALAVAVSQEAPPAVQVPSTESGALAHFDAADQAAAAWHANAALVAVRATEGAQVDARIDPPLKWDTSTDPSVGNGLALVWTFIYVSPNATHESFWVSIGGDGSLLYARALTEPGWCCEPVAVASHVSHEDDMTHDAPESSNTTEPEWYVPPINASIDAPAAVAAALAEDAFEGFALDHPVHMVELSLMPGPDGHGLWSVSFMTATRFSAHALVDGETGEVLESGSWPSPCYDCYPRPVPPLPPVPPTPPEPCCKPEDVHKTYTGEVSASQPFSVYFDVIEPVWLSSARITASVSDVPDGDEVTLVVLDGDYREVHRSALTGSGTLEANFDAVPTWGGYSAMIERTSPVMASALPMIERPIPVEIGIDLVYADAPQERPTEWRFTGEAWPGEQWISLNVMDANWWMMTPETVTLTWDAEIPVESLDLVIYDTWGNVAARASGDDLPQGTQSITLEVPADTASSGACCWSAAVAYDPPFYLGVKTVPFVLDLVTAPAPEPDAYFYH